MDLLLGVVEGLDDGGEGLLVGDDGVDDFVLGRVGHLEDGPVHNLDVLLQEALQVGVADPAIVYVVDHHPQVRLVLRYGLDDVVRLADHSVPSDYDGRLADLRVWHLVV